MRATEPHRACAVCGDAAGAQPYCTLDGFAYVSCRQCGLVYVDRMASEAEMRVAYTGGSVRKLRRRLLAPFRKFHHHKHFERSLARARGILAFAVSHLMQDRSGIRFLDIGCNRGFLLAAALERDARVYGVELVAEQVAPFCNTYPHLREHVFSEKLSQAAPRLEDDFFDLITAIDVVEHFEDPVSDMRQMHRMLRPGGVLVVQTPDAGCARARGSGCAWGALKPLEHLHLFNRDNFVALGDALGFRAVHVGEPFEHADGNFVAVLRKWDGRRASVHDRPAR